MEGELAGKTRSPEYPAIGLREAIDKVRAVYNKDYQNRVPKLTIAEHMGYKSLNGGSLPILSALSKYGLIEGRGEETRVSDRALAIIVHEPGEAERYRAVQDAAAAPELFLELSKRFSGGKPSDSAVRSHLLFKKFIPGAADAALRSYRETMELVDAEEKAYARVNPEAAFLTEMQEQEQQAEDEGQDVLQRRASRSSSVGVGVPVDAPGTRKEVITLDEGDVVITFPEGLSAESVADLGDHLELFIRKAKRRTNPQNRAMVGNAMRANVQAHGVHPDAVTEEEIDGSVSV